MSTRRPFRRPPSVSAAPALTLVAGGSAVFVDVRRTPDWVRNHIPEALHVPLTELETRTDELPDDRLLITFCTGGLLSSGAAALLGDLGLDAVNMSRGLIDWRAVGGDLVCG